MVFCLFCLLSVDLAGENSCIQFPFHFYEFLVVDRPCPVLTWQCRKKKLCLQILFPATPSSRERWPHKTTVCDLSSVPSLQMEDGSKVTFLASFVLSLFLSPSTLESDGQLSSPQRVPRCGSFARPSSPCAPFPVSPLPCLRSDTVWLVTVLQGPCQ